MDDIDVREGYQRPLTRERVTYRYTAWVRTPDGILEKSFDAENVLDERFRKMTEVCGIDQANPGQYAVGCIDANGAPQVAGTDLQLRDELEAKLRKER